MACAEPRAAELAAEWLQGCAAAVGASELANDMRSRVSFPLGVVISPHADRSVKRRAEKVSGNANQILNLSSVGRQHFHAMVVPVPDFYRQIF